MNAYLNHRRDEITYKEKITEEKRSSDKGHVENE